MIAERDCKLGEGIIEQWLVLSKKPGVYFNGGIDDMNQM
jgi:hypothetical protein